MISAILNYSFFLNVEKKSSKSLGSCEPQTNQPANREPELIPRTEANHESGNPDRLIRHFEHVINCVILRTW